MSHALPLLIACGLSNIHAATSGPAGIYVIGDTHAVPGEVAKFDFDYVAGYTLRVPWTDIETWNAATQAPQYNFSRMDSILEELRARGKKMTLEIFINKAPTYLLDPPGISTWTNPHPTQGGVQPLPWDVRALAAYQMMIQSMADHMVPGTSWRIADHPSLESVDASIVGLQGLRDLSNTLVNHPDYTRTKFIQSVVDAVAINRLAFSNKYGFLALFLMDDNDAGISMDQAVYARLQTEFSVPGKPSLGYFQETLSDAGPRTDTLGSLLHTASPHTYIMFQALRPWTLRGRSSPAGNRQRHAYHRHPACVAELPIDLCRNLRRRHPQRGQRHSPAGLEPVFPRREGCPRRSGRTGIGISRHTIPTHPLAGGQFARLPGLEIAGPDKLESGRCHRTPRW